MGEEVLDSSKKVAAHNASTSQQMTEQKKFLLVGNILALRQFPTVAGLYGNIQIRIGALRA